MKIDVAHRSRIRVLLGAPVVALLAAACGGGCAAGSRTEGVVTYNVELRQMGADVIDRCNPAQRLRSIQSARKPDMIPPGELTEARYRVYAAPCSPGGEDVVYDVPVSKVARITETSDPISPPRLIDSLAQPESCCRDRAGWWMFDKLELRLALHYRGTKDSLYYPSAAGGTIYRSSLFGTGRGGSTFFGWFEAAGLWNAMWLDASHRLQLGVMCGLWPVDGALFIPVAFHPRFTFTPRPERYSTNCNTWYVYGDIGVPFDVQTRAPIVGNALVRQRYVIGAGIGYDWAWGCVRDFSIDLGIRQVNLPLPPIDCCPSIPTNERYPFRMSNALVLRVGITF